MKNYLLIIVIIIVQIFITGALYSQSPVGKWVEARQNVTLILKGDFTYSLTYPNGSSKGYWSSGGKQFCLRDASGTNPVCYTVISYSASVMDLRDLNGVMLNYRKVNAQRQGQSNPTSSVVKRKIKGGGRVIAEKGGFKLTHGHLRTGIDLTQFIVGQKIKDSEVRELKQKLVEEFNTAPSQILNQLNGIGSSMDKVYSSTDPYKIGLVRQALFAAFYKVTRHMREDQKPLMIQMIKRYIKVLAYDEVNNLVLTNRDVNGYINYIAFNSELAGQKVLVNNAVRNSVTHQLLANFGSMQLSQKQMLTSASLIWQLMEANWKRLNNNQKTQYVNAYRNQIANRFRQTSQGAGYNQQFTPPKNSSGKSLSQRRRDFNAKQNMFRMMQNMNTNSHALSLNIIENIGGTGNYWKVTDY